MDHWNQFFRASGKEGCTGSNNDQEILRGFMKDKRGNESRLSTAAGDTLALPEGGT